MFPFCTEKWIHNISSVISVSRANIKALKPAILLDFRAKCPLFELQTDSTAYKQKSLILRHFQKRLEPINHYKKEK